jgi:hypothetical protein
VSMPSVAFPEMGAAKTCPALPSRTDPAPGDARVYLERFRAKWITVRVKKTRQNKNSEPRSDSIGTEKSPMRALHGSFAPTKKVGALMLLPRSAHRARPDSTVVQGSA